MSLFRANVSVPLHSSALQAASLNVSPSKHSSPPLTPPTTFLPIFYGTGKLEMGPQLKSILNSDLRLADIVINCYPNVENIVIKSEDDQLILSHVVTIMRIMIMMVAMIIMMVIWMIMMTKMTK